MERFSFLRIGGVIFSLFFVGCRYSTQTVDNKIKYDSIRVAESYYLFNDSTKSGCNVHLAFVYPDSCDDQVLKNLQNIFIEKMFGSFLRDKDPVQAAKLYAEHYIEEFKKLESEVFDSAYVDEDEYKNEAKFNYYTKIENRLLYNRNGFISFLVEVLSFEGGLRGSKCIYGYVIDLNTGELLGEEQFAGDKYYSEVACILIDKIAEMNGVIHVKDLENLGYNSLNDIVPNNNFTIDDNGITYYFNENEIASTAIGSTKVFISYEELIIYLKHDSSLFLLANI
jgi:hypothetical protein